MKLDNICNQYKFAPPSQIHAHSKLLLRCKFKNFRLDFFLMLCYSFSPNFNEIRQYLADLCFVVNQFSFLLRRKVSRTKWSIFDVHPSSKNVQITSLYMESLISPLACILASTSKLHISAICGPIWLKFELNVLCTNAYHFMFITCFII